MKTKTIQDLENLVTMLNSQGERVYFIDLAGSSKTPMLCERVVTDVSPRLTTADLYKWIEAFTAGFNANSAGNS